MIFAMGSAFRPFSCYFALALLTRTLMRNLLDSTWSVGVLESTWSDLQQGPFSFCIVLNCFRTSDVIHSTYDLGLGSAFFAFLCRSKRGALMILLWVFVLKHHESGCRRLRLHNAFNLIILAESYHS